MANHPGFCWKTRWRKWQLEVSYIQSCSQIISINTTMLSFYMMDVLPVAKWTIVNHWRHTSLSSGITTYRLAALGRRWAPCLCSSGVRQCSASLDGSSIVHWGQNNWKFFQLKVWKSSGPCWCTLRFKLGPWHDEKNFRCPQALL